MKFVIEHLEPKLWKWCLIEYENISKIVGKNNLIFTNIAKDGKKLEKYAKVLKKSVKEMNWKRMCVLDPDAEKTLVPKDAGKFDYFIFGGILGDYPPRKRTKEELTQFLPGVEKRNIGKKQFSTDNAVYVTHQILSGRKLDEMKFKDKVEIKINEIESVILPFRYPIVNGKPQMSDKIVEYLKKKKSF